ncbi:two-component system response regulator [Shewanella sp. Choline-02u-19]|jgi:putative two-component system response regulator|uniref:HD-GYP domain-containing protein n=1 Tax=unclassified Shewanella TaxID=196818 RepID=UPI000C3392C8|nr:MULTISPECIES: HD domain-containing phosphohydrolase [unclassified Shewanella]PKG58676.1 two-component system response regulator [Shewanella sp. GutDb-MelDb]PKG76282.1 two-component system response regulator [Shewanella sp. GutCb]PKH57437.1 two-component system response regulator [Shewanella sp. Bg11-22]PKI28262.1 two-component system response regulator [Shewanella sp. Choline-02u-19]
MELQTLLVVDDTPANIDVLAGMLKDDYHVKVAKSGEIALKIANKSPLDLILLDIMMPGIDGFEVCRRLKNDHTTRHIPIIFVTAKITAEDELRGLELGAVDYITKPFNPPIVMQRVRTQLALFNQSRELAIKVKQKTAELADTQLKVIQKLGRAAEYKDNETGMHVIRMSHYTHILAKAAGMCEADADMLMAAAPMHDIGKIGINDAILRKPGKLTDEEFIEMKKHAQIGAEIIGDNESELLQMAKIVAISHHEKWNGAGYPNGLKGENIPRIGRIVAIADVFDALTSERPYKRAWTVQDAVSLLQQEAGEHFDPQLVPLFIEHIDEVTEIMESFKD